MLTFGYGGFWLHGYPARKSDAATVSAVAATAAAAK
jgi:hypothetical protein